MYVCTCVYVCICVRVYIGIYVYLPTRKGKTKKEKKKEWRYIDRAEILLESHVTFASLVAAPSDSVPLM